MVPFGIPSNVMVDSVRIGQDIIQDPVAFLGDSMQHCIKYVIPLSWSDCGSSLPAAFCTEIVCGCVTREDHNYLISITSC